MHLLLTCAQKQNGHSSPQANPDGFGGGRVCSSMQSNLFVGNITKLNILTENLLGILTAQDFDLNLHATGPLVQVRQSQGVGNILAIVGIYNV